MKGRDLVAENPIYAAEVEFAILKVLHSAPVRSRCNFRRENIMLRP